jgi:predicted DNA-binding transcriptional regulator YafY
MPGNRGELTYRLTAIPSLLAERPYSQRELAQYFKVHPKTIRRYMASLSRWHPIEERREGRELFYRLAKSYQYKTPQLTPLELATLLLAREAIAGGGLTGLGSPFSKHAELLLLKVKRSLPDSLQAQLDAMASIFGSASAPAKDFSRHAETIDLLMKAALEGHRIRM